MTYKGTLVTDLQRVVEACWQRNRRVCANCGQGYADHCDVEEYCPDFSSDDTAYLQAGFPNVVVSFRPASIVGRHEDGARKIREHFRRGTLAIDSRLPG